MKIKRWAQGFFLTLSPIAAAVIWHYIYDIDYIIASLLFLVLVICGGVITGTITGLIDIYEEKPLSSSEKRFQCYKEAMALKKGEGIKQGMKDLALEYGVPYNTISVWIYGKKKFKPFGMVDG